MEATLLTLKGVKPATIGEGFIRFGFHGEHQSGELQLLIDAQAILLYQLAADVPKGCHIRIDEQRHIQILGQRVALLLLLQRAQLLLHALAAMRDERAMGMIVDMLGTPRFQAKIMLDMHHRRLVAVRLLGYDFKGGSGRKQKRGIYRTYIYILYYHRLY